MQTTLDSPPANASNQATEEDTLLLTNKQQRVLLEYGEANGWPQLWFKPYLAIAAGESYWRTFALSATDEKIGQALEATKPGFSLPDQGMY